MLTLADLDMTDLQIRKSAARAHLDENRLDKALEAYAAILGDYPEDVDAHLILGDLYLAGEDPATAARLFATALRLDPNNPEIVRRIESATAESGAHVPNAGEPVPTHPLAIARLLQRLTGRDRPIDEQDIERAAELLQTIISDPDPAQAVARHLGEVDTLLPALIELNIRQARSDGRPDVARALRDLQTNIQLQLNEATPVSQPLANRGPAQPAQPRPGPFSGIVHLLTPDGRQTARTQLLEEALTGAGCQVQRTGTPNPQAYPDVVIASHPHTRPELMEGLAACRARGIPVVLDLETNLEQMPATHPQYGALGLSTLAASRAYMSALLLADLVTVPSEALAQSLKTAGYRSAVVPDGWSRANSQWDRPSYPRHTFNLGWFGLPGQQEDVLQIRRVIIRVLREFPHTQLVIAGDSQVYQLFDSLPEARRLYLPGTDPEDFPYLLGQADISMLPLRNIPYHHSLSDRLLVEAGARRIPWIASACAAASAWQAGGLIANSLDEWHTYLRQLVSDAGLHTTLSQAGRQRAETEREAAHIGQIWQNLLTQLVEETFARRGDSQP